jgi:hypothetical protein
LAISDDNIAHSTHSVTERVKDRTPREPSYVYARRSHGSSVLAR